MWGWRSSSGIQISSRNQRMAPFSGRGSDYGRHHPFLYPLPTGRWELFSVLPECGLWILKFWVPECKHPLFSELYGFRFNVETTSGRSSQNLCRRVVISNAFAAKRVEDKHVRQSNPKTLKTSDCMIHWRSFHMQLLLCVNLYRRLRHGSV